MTDSLTMVYTQGRPRERKRAEGVLLETGEKEAEERDSPYVCLCLLDLAENLLSLWDNTAPCFPLWQATVVVMVTRRILAVPSCLLFGLALSVGVNGARGGQ